MDLSTIGIQMICLILKITKTCCSTTVSVSWELTNDIIEIGKPITLQCNVSGIKTIDPLVNRQWSIGKDGDLISNNGRSNNPSKYEEYVTANVFSLQINEVTEEDLNLVYECRYGFAIFKKILKVDNDKIVYPPTEGSTDVSYIADGSGVTVSIHFAKVFPLPNCSIEYLNMTVLEFNVLMYNNQEALLSVHIPSGTQKIAGDKDFNIECCISQFNYCMTKYGHMTIYKDHFTSTIIVSSVSVCLVLLLCTLHIIRWRRKRKKSRRQEQGPKSSNPESKEMIKKSCV